MGGIESKVEGVESSEEMENYKDDTKTPTQPTKPLELDPRSPSADIARTPTEVLKTPVQPSSETIIYTNRINTIDDPRSPTTEFNRTPIVVMNSAPKTEAKTEPLTLHNKILDNARLPQLVPTPAKRKIRAAQFPEPRKLGNSNIVLNVPENKRNSIVGLLETNIDFIETDLDAVIQNKSLNYESPVKSILDVVASDDKVELDKCTVNTTEVEGNVEDVVAVDYQCGEDVETCVADAIIPENKIVSPVPTEDDLSSIDVLNQKLTNLIYEDKKLLNRTPSKGNHVLQQRTPLHEQNPNSQLCKSIPILRVSDKPTKPPKSGSKIPVFKDRKGKGKLNVQCENTPPRMKAKPAQWAAEDSMII